MMSEVPFQVYETRFQVLFKKCDIICYVLAYYNHFFIALPPPRGGRGVNTHIHAFIYGTHDSNLSINLQRSSLFQLELSRFDLAIRFVSYMTINVNINNRFILWIRYMQLTVHVTYLRNFNYPKIEVQILPPERKITLVNIFFRRLLM